MEPSLHAIQNEQDRVEYSAASLPFLKLIIKYRGNRGNKIANIYAN